MIIAFVPCRLKSSRLPNKAIEDIYGVSAIERCLLNTINIKLVDKVVLATSTNPEDDILEKHTLNGRVEFARGSVEDVLERFMPIINKYNPEYILRITGDCPMVSFELAEYLIKSHIKSGCDVTLTKSKVALGVNSEVYSTGAIKKLKTLFPSTNYSEYLIWYFLNNPDLFSINRIDAPEKFIQDWRLTLDEFKDLELFRLIYQNLNIEKEPIPFDSIIHFFNKYPEAKFINNSLSVKYRDNIELINFLNKVTKFKI